jgi:hypothetical protein
MAFVNEKISDEDKLKISPVASFENISALAKWIPEYSEPTRWTVDRERDAYVIFLTGGGREQLPYYMLGIDGMAVIFNVEEKGKGDVIVGLEWHWNVYDLRIPGTLKSRRKEIKQLIREGLKERAYFRPFANGGTVGNPNTIVRGNILSFNVEFK